MNNSSPVTDFLEMTEPTQLVQESTVKSYNRRSSILKPQKQRNPLQDLDFNPTVADETTVTRKSRRVSFAAGSQVKEFHEIHTEVESRTVWGPSYEQTVVNSCSDSSQYSDATILGDSNNITNFDVLVKGRIHTSESTPRVGFVEPRENVAALDLRQNDCWLQPPVSSEVIRFGKNTKELGIDDKPLDLTVSQQSVLVSHQASILSNSRFGAQIINGSINQGESSHHSIKTTFYGGDDEMDTSLSMRHETDDNPEANLFETTGYVDNIDLSSSHEFSSTSVCVGLKETLKASVCSGFPQKQHFNKTVLGGNMDITEPFMGGIFQLTDRNKTIDTSEDKTSFLDQMEYTQTIVSHVQRDVQCENTVFDCHMDLTEPVDAQLIIPSQLKYHQSQEKTLFTKEIDLTGQIKAKTGGNQPALTKTSACIYSDVLDQRQVDKKLSERSFNQTVYYDGMELTTPVNIRVPKSFDCTLNKTDLDDMEITKPVSVEMFKNQKQVENLEQTAYNDDMEMTKPVNVAMFKNQKQVENLEQTAYNDDMEITKPVNVAMFKNQKQVENLEQTAYNDDMEITKPVNVAMFKNQKQVENLEQTAYNDDMEITKPVNVAMFKNQKQEEILEQTAYNDDMEMTKPVNVATFKNQKQVEILEQTAYNDDMEITKPVNVAMFKNQKQVENLEQTAYNDDMEITKPVNVAMFKNQKQVENLEQTAYNDDMEITKPVNVAMFKNQKQEEILEQTAYNDDMEMTKPVNVATFKNQKQVENLEQTAYNDDMEITKPVNVAMFKNQKQEEILEQTAYNDDMEITKPVSVAMFKNQKQVEILEQTACKEITKSSAIMFSEEGKQIEVCRKSSLVDIVEINGPINCLPISENHQQVLKSPDGSTENIEFSEGDGSLSSVKALMPDNKLYFFDGLDFTETTCVTYVNEPELRLVHGKSVADYLLQPNDISSPRNHNEQIGSFAIPSKGTLEFTEEINNTKQLEQNIMPSAVILSSNSMQDTLNKLHILPIPEYISRNQITEQPLVSETGSFLPSSEQEIGRPVTEVNTEDHHETVVEFDSVHKVSKPSFAEMQLQNRKRPWQPETSTTNADLCSPPKQGCQRNNDVVPVKTPDNFEQCDITEVSVTNGYTEEGNLSILSAQGMDIEMFTDCEEDNLFDNQLFLQTSYPGDTEEIAATFIHQENSNRHIDLSTYVSEETVAQNIVPEIIPTPKAPETIEDIIRNLEKRSKEWTIKEMTETLWTFSFFCNSLDLMIKLSPLSTEDNEQSVTALNFTSHRTEKSKDLCHFCHKKLMQAFSVERLHTFCKQVSDVAELLNTLSKETAKLKLFVNDFVLMESLYGMKMTNHQQSVYFRMTNYPIFSVFSVTVNMENGWESFSPDDITVLNIVGDTVQVKLIKSLAKGVRAGPRCLLRLLQDIKKYVSNLEKFRPPGPQRWD